MPTNWRGVAAVCGGFLIHFTLGTVYTFGNMSPYIISYMRLHSASKWVTYSDSTWIFSMAIFGQGSAMAFGGILERKLGTRPTALLGSWLMSFGVMISSLTVQANMLAIVVTYGLLFGIGTGIAYAVAMAAAMAWFPGKKGLVGGIVVAGFGGGSLIFDQFQTLYINPRNIHANSSSGHDKYFDQPAVMDRVPSCFLFLGATYALLQLAGVLLLRQPSPQEVEERQELVEASGGEVPPSEAVDPDDPERPAAGRPSIGAVEMLRRPQFWLLWATFLVNSQPIVYLNTQYKSFGLYERLDDHFMAIVGSLAAVCNAGARIVWGHLHDRMSYRPLMFVLTCCMALLLGTFALSTQRWYYLLWVCAMFACFAGNFALFPAVCAKLFGQAGLSVNYGLLFTANATSGIVGAVLTALLKDAIGWVGLFLLGAGFSVIGTVLTLVFPANGEHS